MKCHVRSKHLIKVDNGSVTFWPNNDEKINLNIFGFSGWKINVTFGGLDKPI